MPLSLIYGIVKNLTTRALKKFEAALCSVLSTGKMPVPPDRQVNFAKTLDNKEFVCWGHS